jgi:hypothetical protein
LPGWPPEHSDKHPSGPLDPPIQNLTAQILHSGASYHGSQDSWRRPKPANANSAQIDQFHDTKELFRGRPIAFGSDYQSQRFF